MQDDQLFAGSIVENITLFETSPDLGWAEDCARLAAVLDEIAAMPMGFQTRVGDMGLTISGGQKQRVLIARALYRRPRILVLDEATSALDIETERRVNESIRDLKITRIAVAHRPETIRMADRVIKLEHGKIATNEHCASK